jgi:hypothetical protein
MYQKEGKCLIEHSLRLPINTCQVRKQNIFSLYGKERSSYVEMVLGNGACIWEARFIIANLHGKQAGCTAGLGIRYAIEKG